MATAVTSGCSWPTSERPSAAVGPVWSPTGDRIAYQRVHGTYAEMHEVVLVNVADGTETVIKPPKTEQRAWYPFTVTWSPAGTTLLYMGWSQDEGSESAPGGVIAIPADPTRDVTVLSDSIDRTGLLQPPLGPDPNAGPTARLTATYRDTPVWSCISSSTPAVT